jgi:hypothetical protein
MPAPSINTKGSLKLISSINVCVRAMLINPQQRNRAVRSSPRRVDCPVQLIVSRVTYLGATLVAVVLDPVYSSNQEAQLFSYLEGAHDARLM